VHLGLAGKARELKRKSLIGQAIAVVLGVQILFVGPFIAFSLPTATAQNLRAYAHNRALEVLPWLPSRWQARLTERFPDLLQPARDVRFSLYVPEAPLSVFVGYTLGSLLGLLSGLLFFIFGLIGPLFRVYPFASGGGLDYYTEPGFGYLIGCVVACWCVGRLTLKRRTSFRQALAILAGLAAIHLIGLAYLLGTCLTNCLIESATPLPDWQPWLSEEVRNLTWYPLPYDLIFSVILVGLGFPFRWLVNTLTAPDIAVKPKAQPRLEEI